MDAVECRGGGCAPRALREGNLPFLTTVTCDYAKRPLRGHSLKFACDAGGGDILRVKFGPTNGEVYNGEVAATRLLWALGFGADRMYRFASMSGTVLRDSVGNRSQRDACSTRQSSSGRCQEQNSTTTPAGHGRSSIQWMNGSAERREHTGTR